MSVQPKALVASDHESKDIMLALKSSVYPGARDESINLVLAYCRAAGLDPIQKPVHIVPMWDKNSGQMRDVVMPGIGLYRTQAARSGEYAGVTEPEFGEDVTANIGGVEITYPKSCKITVKRIVQGMVVEFTAKELWLENYAVKGGKERSIAPNAMWMRRPYAQLAKCSEAQALRKAFPELGSQPTAEEMEGKTIDMGEAEVVKPPSITPYPDDKLATMLPTWHKLMAEGVKTADDIIKTVKTKHTLTAEQEQKIKAPGNPPDAKPAPPTDDEWGVAYDRQDAKNKGGTNAPTA